MSDDTRENDDTELDPSLPVEPPSAEPTRVAVDIHAECPTAVILGSAPFVLEPGLNLVDGATWTAAARHPRIAAMIGKELATVDLATMTSDARLDLIGRTTNLIALEHMLATELAKPVIAGPTNRRDPRIVEAAQRKVNKARKRPRKD